MKTLLLLAASITSPKGARVPYGNEVKLDTIRPTSVVAFTGLPDTDIQVLGVQTLNGEPEAYVSIIAGRGAQCENERRAIMDLLPSTTMTVPRSFLQFNVVPRGNTICVRTFWGTVQGVKLFWQ